MRRVPCSYRRRFSFGSYDLAVNGLTYFSSTIELVLGGAVNLGNNKGYIHSINLGGGNNAYDYANFTQTPRFAQAQNSVNYKDFLFTLYISYEFSHPR